MICEKALLNSMMNLWFLDAKKNQPALCDGLILYVIGDIHGRLDCLVTILDRIDQDRSNYPDREIQEIFLGDYVDRGMQSREVIDCLIERRERTGALLLRGNHEEFMRKALCDRAAAFTWCQFGGLETIRSYGVDVRLPLTVDTFEELHRAWIDTVPRSHCAFLDSLALSHHQDDYFFCHAGVRPGVPLGHQEPEDLMNIRDEFLGSTRWHGACVVHGHTPVEAPELLPNRINLDTGAYITGRLSCMRLEGRTRVLLL